MIPLLRLLLATLLLGTTTAAADDSALAVAAMQRDFETVRALLAERGAAVNATGPYGTPALHWLVRVQELTLAERLLQAGADPNLATPLGLLPLHLAIENSDAAMVELLLGHGADPAQPDRTGETPLHLAARSGSAAITALLLARGVSVDALEPAYLQTPLMIAARSGAAAVAELLLAAGADVNERAKAGAVPQFRLPASNAGSKGVGIVRGGWPERGERAPVAGAKTPLLFATRSGHLALTTLLVDAGADLEQPDENGVTPLLNAVLNASIESLGRREADHVAVARFLVERGAEVNTSDFYGQTPLWAAVVLRNLDKAGPAPDNGIDRDRALALERLLLERGADPNARTREQPPEHRWLTRLGDLSWVDFTGQTPFLRAALAGDVTSMRLLVEFGADPNLATFAGTTPLMAAAGVNWVVNQTYDEGDAALLAAVQYAHALGNDVNAVNSMGLTAAHGAANRGSDDILRWLAAQGARLDLADQQGRTPVDWAHGVFLATHPPVDRPATAALIETLSTSTTGTAP